MSASNAISPRAHVVTDVRVDHSTTTATIPFFTTITTTSYQ
jgi:hypothetical protein